MRLVMMFAAALLIGHSTFAERSQSGGGVPSPGTIDPRQRAVEDYQSGGRRLDKIAEMYEKLAATSDAKGEEKLKKQIDKQLKNAEADFRRAVKGRPDLYPALSELGFVLRKQGRFEESLEAYDQALAIEPGYSPAIEYRAEAHLALNRIGEAREAYTILFSGDRPRADVLFAAMKRWVEQRRTDPAGVEATELEQFASWVETRDAIHQQTSSLTSSSTVRSW
ncbi:MAG TPA: tetratricopeptide repeat protein [Thermoanaerobaculia bacterium]|nr:tetratricopeptide repeat protein [Thermoanaerobaculia bacterium]